MRKVLIIGAEGYKISTDENNLNSITWSSIKKHINLSEYDDILINLLSISDEAIRNKLPWNEINSILNIKKTIEILKHDGRIIVLGDPRFDIPDSTTSEDKHKPFLDWTGLLFEWYEF